MATRKRLTAALISISLLTSCAKPYNVPIVVEEPGQQTDTQFDGLADLLKQSAAQNQPLRILWTHGMCSHDASWALRRVVMAAKALNGVPPENKGRATEPQDAYIIESSISTEFGNVEIGFLVWSPLFKPHKDRLKFDRPGKDGNSAFPYARGKFKQRPENRPDERLPERRRHLLRT